MGMRRILRDKHERISYDELLRRFKADAKRPIATGVVVLKVRKRTIAQGEVIAEETKERKIKLPLLVAGTDKFYLSLLGWSLAMMHVIDVLLDSFSRLFRHHRYSPLEKLYSVILFIAGLSLALERLGITYFHETFGERNKIERWFRELKNRTKRFHNNVNSKTLKSIEEIATAVAIVHNLVRIGRGEVIPT
jgi:hypothetical protein